MDNEHELKDCNVQAEILFVGSIAKDLDLIVNYSTFMRSKYDFSDPATKFFYDNLETYFLTFSQTLDETKMNVFMSQSEERLNLYKQYKGWKTLQRYMTLADENDIKNYFNTVKKYSLIREYGRNGFPVEKILSHRNFDKMSPNDIFVIPNPANIKNFYYDKNIKKNDELLFIGSLEERKGVIVLAKALNEVFREYPNLKIKFIGKDTTRNSKNISTIEYIKELVDTKYQDNLIFVGQIPNYDLNLYLNQAKVGIFPSLFDNFPYVILESMITGIHIVGSKNSGMVEMLNDDTSIYNTGDYLDLAKRIIEKYKLSNKSKINKNNIKRVKDIYNSKSVVTNIINFYKKAINNYKPFVIKEMSNVLSKAKIEDNINDYENIFASENDLEIELIDNEKKQIIRMELEKLKDIDKQIFIEYYYKDKSIKKISTLFNMSETKIKSKLFRIRKRIKKSLKGRGYDFSG